MKTININFEGKKIELTSKFAKAASKYGSEEYKQLMAARNDNPTFEVKVIKTSSKKNNSFKGLTIDCMKKYMENHDNENKDNMNTFKILCGELENKDGIKVKATYGEIKSWFLNTYPDFKDAKQSINSIVKQAKETHEQKRVEMKKVA